MKLMKLLEIFSSIIHDPLLFTSARIIPSSFTREDGKMPLRYLLTYLIFRQGKTLSEDICRIYPDLDCLHPPSKQAVLKRMSILNYDVWHKIQELFLHRIYHPMKKKTMNGYLLIAVDGTFVTLPDHPVLEMAFGRKTGNVNKITGKISYGSPQAKVSIMYDVLNKVVLDFQVAHQDISEIPLLFRHLEILEDVLKDYKVIILADRYYGSTELFKYCEMKGYKYIVRAKSNFFKKYRKSIPADCTDCILNILIDKIWQKRIARDTVRRYISIYPVMHVRLVKGHYEYIEEYLKYDGQKIFTEHSCDAEYFTNLKKEEFSREDIIHIYHVERWDIETGYDTLKNQLNIEQLNSANPIAVRNEIMAKIIFFNIENLVRNAAEDKKCADESHLVNNKHVIEMCRSSWFVRSFFKSRINKSELDNLITDCARTKMMIREERHYRRWDKYRPNIGQPRYRIDGRNNPPLKKTKAGFATTNH
jgi:hypothetical protein